MSSIRDRAAAASGATATVTVPEWGVDVEVRAITIAQYRTLKDHADDETNLALRLIVASVYDPESGEPAFTEQDLDMLSGQGVGVIEALLEQVVSVGGLDRKSVEAGKGDS